MKPKRHSFLRPSALAAATAILCMASVHADTFNWTGATNSDFKTASNWTENAWLQWGDYNFGGTPTNPTVDYGSDEGIFGTASLSLLSGLTTDITIFGDQPIVMASARIGVWPEVPASTGNITIASDSQNLTIDNDLWSTGPVTWNVGADRTLTLNGVLQNWEFQIPDASLVKLGEGTAVLAGGNTYTGPTTLSAGTLVAGNSLAMQNSVLDTLNSITGTSSAGLKTTVTSLTLGGLSGDKDLSSVFTTALGGALDATALGGYSDVTELTLNPGTGASHSYSGIIADGASGMGLTKTGSGTQTLSGSNTYTGVTIIAGGTLNAETFSDYGVAGSLGNRAADSSPGDVGILFRGGTLQYTGSTPQSTDRAIRINADGGGGNTGGATIDASGSDPSATLSFTATSSPDFFEFFGNRTLTLTGTNTGDNTFAMAIEEAGTTSFVKNGSGTWVLTGANTYTGNTTVNEGTLRLGNGTDNSNLADTADVIVAAGATLDLDFTGTDTIDELTLGGVPQSPGTYGAGTYSGVTITGTGTLTVQNGPIADPFANWMATNFPGIVAPDNAPTADPDNDGIANLVEYVLQGGDPSVSTTGILPTLDASGANFVFTYLRRTEATGTTQTFQYGSDLSGWTDVPVIDGGIVSITTPEAGIEQVVITVAKGVETKLFGRLQVVK